MTVYPMMVVVQTIPTIAIALFWFWRLWNLAVVLIILTFPIVSILDGFRHCDKDMLTLFSLMRANHLANPFGHLKSLSACLTCRIGSVSPTPFITTVVSEVVGRLFEGLGVYRSRNCFSMIPCLRLLFWYRLSAFLGMKLVDVSENM